MAFDPADATTVGSAPDAGPVAYLIACGRLSPTAAERAARVAEGTGEPVHRVLTKLGLVGDSDLAAGIAHVTGLPLLDEDAYPSAAAHPDIPPSFLHQFGILPLASDGIGAVPVVTADPWQDYPLRLLELRLGQPVRPVLGLPAHIEAAIARLHEAEAAGDAVPADDDVVDADDIERLRDLAAEAPVIRLVNRLLARAVEERASDIHLEPTENALQVRFRVDGAMRIAETYPVHLRAAIASRIKIMARLNIAERRLPQDGRMRTTVRGREIDLRVSSLPVLHGESLVLRILDRSGVAEDLPGLGFDGSGLQRILSGLDRPHGMMLVTGPTGSGKTTTLYAALRRLNAVERKIHTVEDPVEYRVEGLNQIQVQPDIGLSFAAALRSILRQNPNVIMVGEIRDAETAEMAAHSALTGHLVLSTLHTNTAATAVTRLIEMGVENYLLTATVNAVCAQRLVRKLCPACRRLYRPDAAELALLGLDGTIQDNPEPILLYRAEGCAACDESGYRGRSVIAEVLTMSDPIRSLVMSGADASAIEARAVAEGMVSMRQDGLNKVMQGITALDEVLRAVQDG